MVLTSANPLHPVYELLAKGVYSYFSGAPANQALVTAQLSSLGYSIDKIFDDPNSSFQALGLVAKDGIRPPVLVSQGTTDDRDAIDDANPKGVAFNEFTANKDAVKTWLSVTINDKTKNPLGLKADFTGQSSGGALSQWFASEFPDLLREAVTFQSPGITKVASDLFLRKGGEASQITHYIVNGDLVSLGGEAFLPGTIRVGDYQTPAYDPEKYGDKHIAGILNSNLPGVSATVTSELTIALEDLNKPTFTFAGQDWQDFIAKLKQSNPTLGAESNSRAGNERQRVTSGSFNILIGQINQAVLSPNPQDPNLVPAGEHGANGGGVTITDRDELVLNVFKLANDPHLQHLAKEQQIGLDRVKNGLGIEGNNLKPGDPNYAAVQALNKALTNSLITAGDRVGDLNMLANSIDALDASAQKNVGDFINANLKNSNGGNLIDAYFNCVSANPDKIDRFQLLSGNTFGVEDLDRSGGRDFNDPIFNANMKTVA